MVPTALVGFDQESCTQANDGSRSDFYSFPLSARIEIPLSPFQAPGREPKIRPGF